MIDLSDIGTPRIEWRTQMKLLKDWSILREQSESDVLVVNDWNDTYLIRSHGRCLHRSSRVFYARSEVSNFPSQLQWLLKREKMLEWFFITYLRKKKKEMEEKEDFLDFKIRPQITDLFRRFPSPAEVYYVGDAAPFYYKKNKENVVVLICLSSKRRRLVTL